LVTQKQRKLVVRISAVVGRGVPFRYDPISANSE